MKSWPIALLVAALMSAGNAAAQPTPTTAKQPSASAPDRWRISLSRSPMDDSQTVVLSLGADTSVPVWLKSVRPTLILRCKEKTLDTYVVTGTAASVESDDTRTVRLRFDGAGAETQSWLQSNDHDALFAPEPEEFLDRLKRTSRLLFQFVPFNAPPVIVSFATRGLGPRLARLVSACPETTLTAAQRVEQRKRTNPLSQDLVGSTEAEVKRRLGEPHFIDGFRWTFDADPGRLMVFFRDGKVFEATPNGVPLSGIVKRTAPAETSPGSAEKPPDGAIGRCGDGGFVLVSNGDETCKGHGGVAEWYPEKPRPAPTVTVAAVPKATTAPVDVRRTTGPLIGATRDQVLATLGRPALAAGATWYFDTPSGSVRLTFSNEQVSEVVAPEGVDVETLRSMRANRQNAPVLQQAAPPRPPEGAIAQCTDGSYVLAVHKNGLCFGHGGVRQKLRE